MSARYIDEVSVHGVRDIFVLPKLWQKLVMLSAVILAIIAVSAQLFDISRQYANDLSATKISSYLPEQLPALMVCPQFRYLKPEAETNITERVHAYVNGYFFISGVYDFGEERKLGNFELEGHEAARNHTLSMLKEADYSFVRFLTNHSLNPTSVVTSVSGFPPAFIDKAERTTRVTQNGLCYVAESKLPLDGPLSENFVLRVTLKEDADGTTSSEELYRAYVGNMDVIAFESGPVDHFRVLRGKTVAVKIRAVKHSRYSGRKGNRCKLYAKSDKKHCAFTTVNRHVCTKCVMPTPPSANYPEVTYSTKEYCNIYDGMPCIFSIGDRSVEALVNEQCPQQCIDYSFDKAIDTYPSTDTVVQIQMDSPTLSFHIAEYPLVTLSEYLATLGGTVGLYFGASILSFVQFLAYGLGVAVDRRAARKTVTTLLADRR